MNEKTTKPLSQEEMIAVARQRLAGQPYDTVDSLLALCFPEKLLDKYRLTNTEKLKLIGKTIARLQYDLAVAIAAVRTVSKESDRFRQMDIREACLSVKNKTSN